MLIPLFSILGLVLCISKSDGGTSDVPATLSVCQPLSNHSDIHGPLVLNVTCSQDSLVWLDQIQTLWLDPGQACESLADDSTCQVPFSWLEMVTKNCSNSPGVCEVRFDDWADTEKCDKEINQLRIKYQCLNSIRNADQIKSLPALDICGGIGNFSTSGEPGTSGYITSPNYPNLYPDNLDCSCVLVGLNGTQVNLYVLDYDLIPLPNDIMPSDWLEYTWRDDQSFGSGLRITSNSRYIQTESSIIKLNFHTNSKQSAKGFWIQYTGTANGLIYGECNGYVQPESRRASGCLEGSHAQELYLRCPWPQVINVISFYASSSAEGTAGAVNNSLCPTTQNDLCSLTTYRADTVLDQCMHRPECLLTVRAQNVPMCNRLSDYAYVDYYCISIEDSSMDVCGEDKEPGSILSIDSGEGYIHSPDYPSHYPPDTACRCRLSADSQITLNLLDLQLDNSTLNGAGERSDVLEFWTEDEAGNIKFGAELNDANLNAPVYTGSNIVYIELLSDSSRELRGFWMKFTARDANGQYSGIRMTCGHKETSMNNSLWTSPVSHISTFGPGLTAGSSDDSINKALVVGMSILAALLALAFFIILIFLCRRRAPKSDKLDSSEGSSSMGSVSSLYRFSGGEGVVSLPSSGRGWDDKSGEGSDYYTMRTFQSLGRQHDDPTRYRGDAKHSYTNPTFRP